MVASRATIVIVGDEILGGQTQDTNSHELAKRLHTAGVALARVETIPDDAREIEVTLRRLLALDYEWIFVVGGIGPTPDDRTYEGVARALDRVLVIRPEHLEAMRRRVATSTYATEAWSDPETSEPMRRMIRLPEGSEALANPVGAALGCVVRSGTSRLVVLPGVPRELYRMFDESFAPVHLARDGPRAVVAEVEAFGAEASYWSILSEIDRTFPEVKLGSYPQDETGRVVFRLAGTVEVVEKAKNRLLELLGR